MTSMFAKLAMAAQVADDASVGPINILDRSQHCRWGLVLCSRCSWRLCIREVMFSIAECFLSMSPKMTADTKWRLMPRMGRHEERIRKRK
jgi:hypothetical protein